MLSQIRIGARRRLAIGCSLIGVILACWALSIARDVLWLNATIDQLQAQASSTSGSRASLDSLRTLLTSLHSHLSSLQFTAAPLLAIAPQLSWLPGVGPDVTAAPHLVQGGIDLVEAARLTLDVAGPAWPPSAAPGRTVAAELVESISENRPQLDEARRRAARASTHFEAIDSLQLSPWLAPKAERASALTAILQTGLGFVDLLPDLAGLDRPKTYLVLLQNADELRPAGGFITAVARVTLDRGEIAELDVRDNAVMDDFLHKPYEPPPAPLLEVMGLGLWLFRDANWSPDFPTSARKAADLYTYGLGVPVDGVIGLNQRVVRGIMTGLGPLAVEPGQPPVDASNVIEYMRRSWSSAQAADRPEDWIAGRKGFIDKLARSVLSRIQMAPDRIDWLALGRAMLEVLDSRDLLIWIDESATAARLAELGWDGAIRPSTGDYWMLVDANLGYNKVNAVVDSTVHYSVTLHADGSADATLVARYAHHGSPVSGCQHMIPYTLSTSYETLMNACYWDYVRLLVPLGATLQASTSHPVPAEYVITGRAFDGAIDIEREKDKTALGTLFVLEPSQTLDVKLSYTLPAVVDWSSGGGQYQLTMQKQAGGPARSVTMTLVWPDAYALSVASVPPVSQADRSATFAFDLATDRTLSVAWNRR